MSRRLRLAVVLMLVPILIFGAGLTSFAVGENGIDVEVPEEKVEVDEEVEEIVEDLEETIVELEKADETGEDIEESPVENGEGKDEIKKDLQEEIIIEQLEEELIVGNNTEEMHLMDENIEVQFIGILNPNIGFKVEANIEPLSDGDEYEIEIYITNQGGWHRRKLEEATLKLYVYGSTTAFHTEELETIEIRPGITWSKKISNLRASTPNDGDTVHVTAELKGKLSYFQWGCNDWKPLKKNFKAYDKYDYKVIPSDEPTGILEVEKIVEGKPTATPEYKITLEKVEGLQPRTKDAKTDGGPLTYEIKEGTEIFTGIEVGRYKLWESKDGGADEIAYDGDIESREENYIVIEIRENETTNIIITNTFREVGEETGILKITKVIEGTPPEGEKEYEIILQEVGTGSEEEPISRIIKAGENEFSLPIGDYDLKESPAENVIRVIYEGDIEDQEGWRVVEIEKGKTTEVTITNIYEDENGDTEEGNLKVKKVVVNEPTNPPTSYNIKIYKNNETQKEVKTFNLAAGEVKVDSLDVGSYIIVEEKPNHTLFSSATYTIEYIYPEENEVVPMRAATTEVNSEGAFEILEGVETVITVTNTFNKPTSSNGGSSSSRGSSRTTTEPEPEIEIVEELEIEIIEEEPEIEILEDEPEEEIILEEEVPVGIPQLPKTGETNPIGFYLLGLLLTAIGLRMKKVF